MRIRPELAASVPLLACLLFFGFGCGAKTPRPVARQEAAKPGSVLPAAPAGAKGFGLSPKSPAPADLRAFFEKASRAGKAIAWTGDAAELADEKSAPRVLAALSKTYGYEPVIMAQYFDRETGKLLRPLDDKNRAAYLDQAAKFAAEYRPARIGFGVEVNILRERSPKDLDAFMAFYKELRDKVMGVSPDTRVFTVFQLERTKGLRGGLSGGKNDPTKTDWDLVARAAAMSDLVAFTTYPGLVYKDPADIPDGYYDDIAKHVTLPFAFTAVGWNRTGPKGWESSDDEQAAFITRFFTLTDGLRAELRIWNCLYDQPAPPPFDAMGLLAKDADTSAAWGSWILN